MAGAARYRDGALGLASPGTGASTAGSRAVRRRLLDDKSRYLVALRAFPHERETAMLDLVLEAVRLFGAPRRLYLDNGRTYHADTNLD